MSQRFSPNLLGGYIATVKALKLFVEAFVKSMPTGKINTFANQTLPQALLVCLRKDRPVSLVSAFEQPIQSSQGYVEQSIMRLTKEYELVKQWVAEPSSLFSLGMNEFPENKVDLNQLLAHMEESLNSLLES